MTTTAANLADVPALSTAGLVVVRQGRLLLAYSRNKQAWYLPGGKVDAGETPEQALRREIEEELNLALRPERLRAWGHVTALAYGEVPPRRMEQDCFLYALGDDEKLQPRQEIAEVRFFDAQDYARESAQVSGVLQVMQMLRADGLM
ncbi:MAG: NUDIX domain-containing protein [Burkholderiaceae bacterium]|jgi:8-oxo-dGTP pyrophosphatase MutT (NUDIX family)|nr:NUDIX domain-containing protein [Burkholderiaceae bacterium]